VLSSRDTSAFTHKEAGGDKQNKEMYTIGNDSNIKHNGGVLIYILSELVKESLNSKVGPSSL
jgi:hypothetical protein